MDTPTKALIETIGDAAQPRPHYGDKRGANSHRRRHEALYASQLARITQLLRKSFLG